MVAAIVQVSNFDEPEELLLALRGSNDELWEEAPQQWVFRGHADADWRLLPTVLRDDSRLTHHPQRTAGPYPQVGEQLRVEMDWILRFAEVANARGLPVPGGLNVARRYLTANPAVGSTFPPFELWDLFALAQHHGVPTRFLDWSRNPLTAAYFAARGAAQSMNAGPLPDSVRLAVWALNCSAVSIAPTTGERVDLVDPPRYGNPNMIAQEGLFTVHVAKWTADAAPVREPLDDSIERLYAPFLCSHPMRLLTLPARKARKLLVRLENERVDSSALFPGYDGAARLLLDELLLSQSAWQLPPDEH